MLELKSCSEAATQDIPLQEPRPSVLSSLPKNQVRNQSLKNNTFPFIQRDQFYQDKKCPEKRVLSPRLWSFLGDDQELYVQLNSYDCRMAGREIEIRASSKMQMEFHQLEKTQRLLAWKGFGDGFFQPPVHTGQCRHSDMIAVFYSVQRSISREHWYLSVACDNSTNLNQCSKAAAFPKTPLLLLNLLGR